MDLRTVVTFSALLLMAAESQRTPEQTPNATSTSPLQITSSSCTCAPTARTSSSTSSSSTVSSAPSLGLLFVSWTSDCEGEVTLALPPSSPSPSHVCDSSQPLVQPLLRTACQSRRGCTEPLRLETGRMQEGGYDITEGRRQGCKSLKLQCEAEADVQGQLQSFKVATALLCCVLLLLILIFFTRPTVRALQSRLSDRRQNRWIGPTQSHSVSYHRGKNVAQSDDREKRLSYPALERLAVSDSREPSSNRNSDYNF
uniref:uncharacterized protein n=1 Tax=Semicossyphus pulcher TaxID=241346 RepID=UPI0037E92A9C